MKQAKKSEKENSKEMLAVVRIRGINEIRIATEDTLRMLRVYRKNYCVVLPNTPVYVGMIKQAKDYITWGEIDNDTLSMLIEKRAEEFKGRETDNQGKFNSNDFAIVNGKKIKKFFRLNAPKKGYGKKGIKHTFTNGGALGYRGVAINELIRRMV